MATHRQPVLGGVISDQESVVMVQRLGPDGGNYCSGTLVAPNVVVTARHCVSAFVDGEYSCTIDGDLDLSRPRSPANAGDMGLPSPPEQIAVHVEQEPDFDLPTVMARLIIAPESNTICRNDIAFLVLEEELELPLSTLRLDSGILPQETVTVVGYGINDVSRTVRTERSGVAIEAVGPSEFYEVEGNAMPRTFVLGRSVCPGDSGGPAFSDETGELLGVFSLYRGDCTSSEVRNFMSQAAPYGDFARSAFAEAGYEALLDDEDSPSVSPPVDSGGGGAAMGGTSSTEAAKDPAAARNDLSDEGASGCALARPFASSGPSLPWFLLLFWAVARRRKGGRGFGAAGVSEGP